MEEINIGKYRNILQCEKPVPFEGHYRSDDPDIIASGAQFPPMEICRHCGKPIPWEGWSFGTYLQLYPNVPICDCIGAQEEEKARQEAEEAERKRQIEQRKAEAFAEKIRQIMADSGMDDKFHLRTFETFEMTGDNGEAFMACKAYAQHFEQIKHEEKNGLYIYGPMGTGKTHLAAAIANEILQEGQPFIMMTATKILQRIRKSYQGGDLTEYDLLQTFREIPLLIIDDLGKEAATEWSASLIFQLINARYETMLPTIITTNYSQQDLIRRLTPRGSSDQITAAATVDRLKEMCRSYQITGDSWRR